MSPVELRRQVRRASDGRWAVHAPGTARASKVCEDRADALAWARRSLSIAGGGLIEVELQDGGVDLVEVPGRRGGPRPNTLVRPRGR